MRAHHIVLTLFGMILLAAVGCQEIDTTAIRAENLKLDFAAAASRAPAPQGPVTLDDAIAYALENNLELWMARQEQAIALERKSAATLKLLPRLRANQEYSRRDRYSASNSVNLFTGQESLTTSFSSEKKRDTFDLQLTWNLLDFGVTYMRARQEAGRVVIAEQDLIRMRQRVVMDVSNAYWEAVAAKRLADEADGVLEQIDRQLAAVHGQQKKGNISESAALNAELPLLRQRHRMRTYRRNYETAVKNLTKLMGVPIGADLALQVPANLAVPATELKTDVAAFEKLALTHRPELVQEDMRSRITHQEARIALIEMFPSPSIFWRYSHDNNKYIHHNDWQTAGLTAVFDILSLPAKWSELKNRKNQEELIQKRRLASTVAVLTQMHIALIEYQSARVQMADVEQIEAKSKRLVDASEKAAEGGKGHAAQTLALKTQRIRDLETYLLGYTSMMQARARFYNSLGIEPGSDGAKALATALATIEEEIAVAEAWAEMDEPLLPGGMIPATSPIQESEEAAVCIPQGNCAKAATIEIVPVEASDAPESETPTEAGDMAAADSNALAVCRSASDIDFEARTAQDDVEPTKSAEDAFEIDTSYQKMEDAEINANADAETDVVEVPSA